MQLLVHFLSTFVVDLIPSTEQCPIAHHNIDITEDTSLPSQPNNQLPYGCDVRDSISKRSGIPSALFTIRIDGKLVQDSERLDANTSLIARCTFVNALPGGKGGFGAALRAAAKQRGPKRTTDFGSCRDLSGRRLRSVNDEILLQKWKAAHDKGEDFDVESSTPSGINMWYLRTPNWADPFKESYRKKFMKNRLKTDLCTDWLRARANTSTGSAPPGAPQHWGCPRGHRCEFAHGEEELAGGRREKEEDRKRREREEAVNKDREAYLSSAGAGAGSEGGDDDWMQSAVAAGLQQQGGGGGYGYRKRVKLNHHSESGSSAGARAGTGAGAAEAADGGSSNSNSNSNSSSPVAVRVRSEFDLAQHVTLVAAMADEEEEDKDKDKDSGSGSAAAATARVKVCRPRARMEGEEGGAVSAVRLSTAGDAAGAGGMDGPTSGMLTAVATGCPVPLTSSAALRAGLYYEVVLQSSGLIQVGWATDQCALVQKALQGDTGAAVGDVGDVNDGVGDDEHSFAYDGWRQRKWWAGQEEDAKGGATATSTSTTAAGEGASAGDDSSGGGAAYGEGITWGAGDIVGCLLQQVPSAQTAAAAVGTPVEYDLVVSFSLNSIDLGEAFRIPLSRLLSRGSDATSGVIYPAVSMEYTEGVVLNLGQPRDEKAKPCEDMSSFSFNPASTFTNAEQVQSQKQHGSVRGLWVVTASSAASASTTAEVKEFHQPRPPFDALADDELQDASKYPTAEMLEAKLGADYLKWELSRRGLKSGGTGAQRAERLFSVRHLKESEIPNKLKAPASSK